MVDKFKAVLTSRLVIRPVLRQLSHSQGAYAAQILCIITEKCGLAPFRSIYLPHIQSQIEMHQTKVTPKAETVFRNTAHMLRCVLGQMTLTMLLEMLSEILATIIEPVLRVLVSVHSVFTQASRPELTKQCVALSLHGLACSLAIDWKLVSSRGPPC